MVMIVAVACALWSLPPMIVPAPSAPAEFTKSLGIAGGDVRFMVEQSFGRTHYLVWRDSRQVAEWTRCGWPFHVFEGGMQGRNHLGPIDPWDRFDFRYLTLSIMRFRYA